MRSLMLVILSLVIFVPFAYSIKCHFCDSQKTDLDCFARRDSKECYDEGYSCGKVMYKVRGQPFFSRGCVSKAYCRDQDAFCRAGKDRSNCEVYCCDNKECNTGARKLVSGVAIFGCALVAMFFQAFV